MNIEALKQQLTEGKITKEQFAAELKKLLDAGTITQEEHDEAMKFEGKKEDPKPLTAEEIQALIKAESQKEADRVRTEYAAKLKKEQEEKEKLLKEKMSDEEKAKFEKEKYDRELKEREDKLNAREVELHVIDELTKAKLPLSFKPFLVSGTKEDATKNIEAFQTAWQTELEAAVQARFKDGGDDQTKRKQGGGGQKKWKEMTLTERGNLVKADVELARTLAREAGENPKF